MSNFNRKGPQNEGPMTGRKQGLCNPENRGLNRAELVQKDQPVAGYGRGLGMRRGRGFGMGNGRGQGNFNQ